MPIWLEFHWLIFWRRLASLGLFPSQIYRRASVFWGNTPVKSYIFQFGEHRESLWPFYFRCCPNNPPDFVFMFPNKIRTRQIWAHEQALFASWDYATRLDASLLKSSSFAYYLLQMTNFFGLDCQISHPNRWVWISMRWQARNLHQTSFLSRSIWPLRSGRVSKFLVFCPCCLCFRTWLRHQCVSETIARYLGLQYDIRYYSTLKYCSIYKFYRKRYLYLYLN